MTQPIQAAYVIIYSERGQGIDAHVADIVGFSVLVLIVLLLAFAFFIRNKWYNYIMNAEFDCSPSSLTDQEL